HIARPARIPEIAPVEPNVDPAARRYDTTGTGFLEADPLDAKIGGRGVGADRDGGPDVDVEPALAGRRVPVPARRPDAGEPRRVRLPAGVEGVVVGQPAGERVALGLADLVEADEVPGLRRFPRGERGVIAPGGLDRLGDDGRHQPAL